MNRLKKIFFAVTILIALAVVLGLPIISRGKALGLVHPERTSPSAVPTDYGILEWQEVSFESPDGVKLSGWYFPPTDQVNRTIVFVHGLGNNRDHLLPEAGILASQGYGGLLFDLRNHGQSEGEVTTFGVNEIRDVQGAVDFLLARPEVNPDGIAILGHSMGASISLMAAAEIPEIQAVVAESAYASLEGNIDYGVEALTGLPAFPFADLIAFFAQQEAGFDVSESSPISVLDQIAPRPILFIQGTEDEKVHPDNAQWLYDAAAEPKALFYVEGAMHRIGLVDAQRDAFEEQLISFLDQHLGQ